MFWDPPSKIPPQGAPWPLHSTLVPPHFSTAHQEALLGRAPQLAGSGLGAQSHQEDFPVLGVKDTGAEHRQFLTGAHPQASLSSPFLNHNLIVMLAPM